MAKRDFCDAYGVRVPVVLAGMAIVAEPELVAAVSEAGGLGMLGTGPIPPEAVRERIAAVRARTSRPFGVNHIVESGPLGQFVGDDHLALDVAERVDPVVFHWNAPEAHWLATLADAGLRAWRTVNSAEEAERAVAEGYAALVAQGAEAGGHNRATQPLERLLPEVARVAGECHVVAAGGIADAPSVAAAFERGADAVCMGTRFVACVEAEAHPGWQQRIVEAGADDTAITRIFGPEWPDAPMRVLRNRAVRRAERGEPLPEGLATIGTTSLAGAPYPMPPHSVMLPTRATEGDLDEMCLAAGTSAAAIARIERAADVVVMVAEAVAR